MLKFVPETMRPGEGTLDGRSYLVWTGPYRIFVYIFEGTQWRGTLDTIEVADAFLEVHYGDNLNERTALTDWNRVAESIGVYYIGRLPQKTLDVDHARVKDIEFYLEFTAILKDGTRHKQLTQRRLRPVVIREDVSSLPKA